VLVFNHTADGVVDHDTLKYWKTVSKFVRETGTNNYSYTFKLELTESNAPIDMWILGNAAAKWDVVAASLVGKHKSDVAAALVYSEADGVTQVTAGAPADDDDIELFPLWGVINNVAVEKPTGTSTSVGLVKANNGGGNTVEDVSLYRMVAKIDVQLSGTAKNKHSVKEVIFYNRNTKGALVPHTYTYPADGKFATPSLAPGPGGSEPAPNNAANSVTYEAVADSVLSSIYAFEVAANGDNSGEYTKEPCLILGAQYTATSPITWYRVPFVDNTSGTPTLIPILRNRRYIVTVSALNSEGASTPDIALNTVNVNNIVASVLTWEDVLIDFPD
jgi:hypothetical protein